MEAGQLEVESVGHDTTVPPLGHRGPGLWEKGAREFRREAWRQGCRSGFVHTRAPHAPHCHIQPGRRLEWREDGEEAFWPGECGGSVLSAETRPSLQVSCVTSLEGQCEIPVATGDTACFQAPSNSCVCMSGLPAWGQGNVCLSRY